MSAQVCTQVCARTTNTQLLACTHSLVNTHTYMHTQHNVQNVYECASPMHVILPVPIVCLPFVRTMTMKTVSTRQKLTLTDILKPFV